MLWLINGEVSHQIISCNIHNDNGVYQLWITRPNGKSLKIAESKLREEIEEIKGAIDYAIEIGESALRL